MVEKNSKLGHITKYGTRKNPDMGFIHSVEESNDYRFLKSKCSEEVQELLEHPESWETTTIYFDVFDGNKTDNIRLTKETPRIGNPLFDVIYFQKGYYQALQELAELALPEPWHYGKEFPNKGDFKEDYPILDNYLKYSFAKLREDAELANASNEKQNNTENTFKNDGLVISTNQKFATFNTGLVNSRYQPIYAFLTQNAEYDEKDENNKRSPWIFDSFCIEGEKGHGKDLVSYFEHLPGKANFFTDPTQLIYEYDQHNVPKRPRPDFSHIIRDNFKRLPKEFVLRILNNNEDVYDKLGGEHSTREDREKYFSTEEGKQQERQLHNELKSAIETALVKVSWNFKTAIPMWYPKSNKKNKLSLLLPLCLVEDDQIDVALIVERQESGNYLGHTIITLDLAYKDARLITRPDSEWLNSSNILLQSNNENE